MIQVTPCWAIWIIMCFMAFRCSCCNIKVHKYLEQRVYGPFMPILCSIVFLHWNLLFHVWQQHLSFQTGFFFSTEFFVTQAQRWSEGGFYFSTHKPEDINKDCLEKNREIIYDSVENDSQNFKYLLKALLYFTSINIMLQLLLETIGALSCAALINILTCESQMMLKHWTIFPSVRAKMVQMHPV